MKRKPLKLFFCYAHEDTSLRATLDQHLDLLEREGLVAPWYDGAIIPGTQWSETIQENLRGADIVVLLISNAFLESEYIAEVEMRLTLALHAEGQLVPIPVLVEEVPDFYKLPLAQFEALPSKARAINTWDDLARACDDVTIGIRRAAIKLLVESGSYFEPTCHYFTEAELVRLQPEERTRCITRLRRLRTALVETIPQRRMEQNLLLANWCLNKFGHSHSLEESLFYIAQVISAFDVVSLQEIDRHIGTLRYLLEILGPEWGYFITDITEGTMGNNERYAIVYYQPRVSFDHVSGEVILPDDLLIKGRQFARKPLLASFRAGDFRFRVCATHIHYGGGDPKPGILECQTLARFLRRVSERDNENILLAGNFNLRRPDSPAAQAFSAQGFSLIVHPTSAFNPDVYHDMLGYLMSTDTGVRSRASGSFQTFDYIYRDDEIDAYLPCFMAEGDVTSHSSPDRSKYRRWRTQEISDHLPLWGELQIGNVQ